MFREVSSLRVRRRGSLRLPTISNYQYYQLMEINYQFPMKSRKPLFLFLVFIGNWLIGNLLDIDDW